MAETEPNDAMNDELLSAYVDGELSGDQLAQVEQRLRTDSAARQLVDELRSLSATLQAMPREAVGENLSESVLQRAERSKLSEEVPTTAGARRWVWAAMALAAALMLMIVQPEDEQQEQKVASAVAEREQEERQEPELRASVAAPMEADEEAAWEGAEEKMVVADSLKALAEATVDEVEVLSSASVEAGTPVREVHLELPVDFREFDQLLAVHGVVRVDGLAGGAGGRLNRNRSGKGAEFREKSSAKSERKVLPTKEILVEGTAEQIEKLLLTFRADKDSSDRFLATDSSVAGAKLGKLLSPRSEGVFDERLSANNSSANESAPGGQEIEKVAPLGGAELSKDGTVERIRVLFVLYPAPQPAKPAATNKKVRSSEKVGGKEG